MYDRFGLTRLVVTPLTNEQGVEVTSAPALPPEAIPLLEDLLRTYEQIARSAGEFPRLQTQAAEANHRIGDIHQRLGRFEQAVSAYRAAIELYTRLDPDLADDSVRIKLVRTCNELGRTLSMLRRFEEADRMHEQAIQHLADAPKALAERPECRYELARSYYILGQRNQVVTLRSLGPPRPGRPGEPPPGPPGKRNGEHGQRAVVLLEQLVREFPTVPEYRHLLACCYRDVPPERFGRGQPPPSSNRDRAVELLRQLVAEFPKVPDYLFDLCETLGRPRPPEPPGTRPGEPRPSGRGEGPIPEQQFRERLEQAIALSAKLVTDYPNIPDYASAHARYLEQYGVTLFLLASSDAAEKQLREAVAVQSRVVKRYPEVVAYGFWMSMMERSLGRVLIERGKWKEARARLESAIDRLEALRKQDPSLRPVRPILGAAYRDLSQALTGAGEKELAAEVFRKSEEFEKDRFRDPFAPRDRGNPRP
jgi:tetratricopeptide (TPR) repeat protein